MKISFYFHLLIRTLIALMFIVSVVTPIQARELSSSRYEIRQKESSDEIEIIIPGRVKETKKLPKTDEQQAVADAKRDAQAHFNKLLWFTTGCLVPIYGPMSSQRNLKTIPAARTIGKPAQYVAFYIDTYEIEMKRLRYNWALGGCLVGALIDVSLVSIFLNYYLD